MRRGLVVSLAALLSTTTLSAQLPASVDTTLHRLFASSEFAPQRFGPARWIEEGSAYTTLEKAADSSGYDIVR